jgi:hypothetical protein
MHKEVIGEDILGVDVREEGEEEEEWKQEEGGRGVE